VSVIDPGPDRYYGARDAGWSPSGTATLGGGSPRLDVLIPASLLVLLALGRGPLHAYGVMLQVERDSGTLMGKAAILGTLDRLEEAGWVAAREESEWASDRTFEMTPAGRNALRAEIGRIQRLGALARERRIVP
jgi:DNA-binding transcriptional ArsR family regulator